MGRRKTFPRFLARSIGFALLGLAAPAHGQDGHSARPRGGAAPSPELGTTDASAEQSDARALAEKAKVEFNRGNQAYEQGNYRKAAEAFEQAHRLSPHSAVLFNAARAWWKMGESERAADNYAEAIRRGELTSEQTLRARSALSNLRKKLGWVIVSGAQNTRISVGHKSDAPLPLTTHLAPGDHVLRLNLNGESWEQLVTVVADAPLSVVAKKEPDQAAPDPPRETPPPPPIAQGHGQRTWGWVTFGVGSALGAGAVATGLFTLNARNEFNALNDGTPENVSAARERRDEAKTWRTVTNALAISGGAAALTGFTLVLAAPSARKSARRVVAVAVGPGQLHVSGRF